MFWLSNRQTPALLAFAFTCIAAHSATERLPGDTLSTVKPPRKIDSVAAHREPVPDSTWRWPSDPRTRTCSGPLETPSGCWRLAPDIVFQETGFPGLRSTVLNLRDLEPSRVGSFFQPGLVQSPYGSGGHIPFTRFETGSAGGTRDEVWAPVQPLDTPPGTRSETCQRRTSRPRSFSNTFGWHLEATR